MTTRKPTDPVPEPRDPGSDASQRADNEGPAGFPQRFDEQGTTEDLQHGGYQGGDQGGYQGTYDEGKFEHHPLAVEKAESPDPGDTRTDAQLLEDVRRRLAEGGPYLEAGDVSVEVRQGKAILQGSVAQEQTRRDIAAAVSRCEGLLGLDNRIKVLAP
jgi:Putative phospholipid-binding domain.